MPLIAMIPPPPRWLARVISRIISPLAHRLATKSERTTAPVTGGRRHERATKRIALSA
jgi:hypothetical protein